MTTVNQNKRVLNKLNGAKFGFAVTLLALLAACSHKPVETDTVDMTPVAASDEAMVADAPAVAGDEATPFPEADQTDATAPVAASRKVVKSHAKHARKHLRVAATKHGKKHAGKHATHARKVTPNAAAVGQVNEASSNNVLPPPAPVMPDSTSSLSALNAAGTDSMTNDGSTSHRSLWIIGSALIAALTLLGSYRGVAKRRTRGIVFNA